jgi:hypothetical protein
MRAMSIIVMWKVDELGVQIGGGPEKGIVKLGQISAISGEFDQCQVFKSTS